LPLIIFAALAVVAVYIVGTYNSLVTFKARIKASIQEIGNQLKRQAELIPNLEVSAKSYLKHEKDIIKLIADARKTVTEAVASGNLDAMANAGEKVANLLPQIRVAVESNPEIKGAEVITKLMDELRDTSDKVMYARRTLIDLTADYNIQLVAFPSNFIAGLFGFTTEKGLATPDTGAHLEVSDSDIKTPKVSL
jgi:LemA protein